MKLFCFYEQPPECGTSFIALFSDGSGADLFLRADNGDYHNANNDINPPDSHWFADSGYLWFAVLPDDFRLFFEEQAKNEN